MGQLERCGGIIVVTVWALETAVDFADVQILQTLLRTKERKEEKKREREKCETKMKLLTDLL